MVDKVSAHNMENFNMMYYIGGMAEGYFWNTWRLSINIDEIPEPYLFNTTYLANRDTTKNYIEALTPTTSESFYTRLCIYYLNCDNTSYPYLLFSTQRCYDECPDKYYNNLNNRCVKCLGCTNLNDCNMC